MWRLLICSLGLLFAVPASADPLELAGYRVAEALSLPRHWDGPEKGPPGAEGKRVVFIGADLRNQGIAGVLEGVREAAAAIGWNLTVMDAEGSDTMRVKALKAAAALKPDGVIFGGFDALRYAPWIDNVSINGTITVGWHAAYEPGMVPGTQLFTNVATSARQVALAAASYAVVTQDGKAGVVIFTDSAFAVAQAKSDDMAVIVSNCVDCTLLAVVDMHLSEVDQKMAEQLTSLRSLFGNKWTAALGINDLYFDALAKVGGGPPGLLNVSAGDGSQTAFERIRDDRGQKATVAEPLNLQGWQLIDELNRGFAGVEPSGYVPAAHLVIRENVGLAGGTNNAYDPDNGYREAYRKIWQR